MRIRGVWYLPVGVLLLLGFLLSTDTDLEKNAPLRVAAVGMFFQSPSELEEGAGWAGFACAGGACILLIWDVMNARRRQPQ